MSFCESQSPKRGERSRRRLYLVTRVVNLQGESTESDVVVAASNKFYSSRMAPFKEANCTPPLAAPRHHHQAHRHATRSITRRQARIRPAGACLLRWGSCLPRQENRYIGSDFCRVSLLRRIIRAARASSWLILARQDLDRHPFAPRSFGLLLSPESRA
mgnify:CR=1 FL=1